MPFKVQVGPPQIAIHHGQTVLITGLDGQINWPSDRGLYFNDTVSSAAGGSMPTASHGTFLTGGATTYYTSEVHLTNRAITTETAPFHLTRSARHKPVGRRRHA